jgi:hypothetical protein
MAQTLRYSNFFITISTNVVPSDNDEKDALTEWLINVTDELFGDFDVLNGNCIKPPGTRNYQRARFPDDNKIIQVRARVSVEQGAAQQGQVHAHVLLEIAHRYLRQEDGATGIGQDTNKPHLGVHVNVEALREWLNARIPAMDIPAARQPPKVYVNCKLLTKGTDNSNKWLTLQYINKDRAKDGHGGHLNLRAQERNTGDADLSRARQLLLNGGVNGTLENHTLERDDPIGVGGALAPEEVFENIIRQRPAARPQPPAVAPNFVRNGVQLPVAPAMNRVTVPVPAFKVTSGQNIPAMRRFQ